MAAMKESYKDPDTAERVFYASRNKGTIEGVDPESSRRKGKASRFKKQS